MRGQTEFLDERKPVFVLGGKIDRSSRLSHFAAPRRPLYLVGWSNGHWCWQTRNAHDQDGTRRVMLCRCRGHLREPIRGDERIRVQVDHPDRILAHVNGQAWRWPVPATERRDRMQHTASRFPRCSGFVGDGDVRKVLCAHQADDCLIVPAAADSAISWMRRRELPQPRTRSAPTCFPSRSIAIVDGTPSQSPMNQKGHLNTYHMNAKMSSNMGCNMIPSKSPRMLPELPLVELPPTIPTPALHDAPTTPRHSGQLLSPCRRPP
jgi:hypothetical protein